MKLCDVVKKVAEAYNKNVFVERAQDTVTIKFRYLGIRDTELLDTVRDMLALYGSAAVVKFVRTPHDNPEYRSFTAAHITVNRVKPAGLEVDHAAIRKQIDAIKARQLMQESA